MCMYIYIPYICRYMHVCIYNNIYICIYISVKNLLFKVPEIQSQIRQKILPS